MSYKPNPLTGLEIPQRSGLVKLGWLILQALKSALQIHKPQSTDFKAGWQAPFILEDARQLFKSPLASKVMLWDPQG